MPRPAKVRSTFKSPAPIPQVPVSAHTFPAPIRGWILNENISNPQPAGASVLDNWICTTTGAKPRGGTQVHTTLPAAVTSLLVYQSGGSQLMFGATTSEIYDVSASSVSASSPAISGQSSGDYSAEQFGTTGGDYLSVVNGSDEAQLFDGTAWQAVNSTSTPISINGADTSDFSYVWSFANRLFYVKRNSSTAYYLPTDSIGGTVSTFSLAGVFKDGGTLAFGASWSLSAGDGLGDKCVFFSSEGEVAVYEGTNPGNAATFQLVGVYQITKSLGKNAFAKAGGDLLVATESGMVPLSQAISTDVAALSLAAVSAPISPYWQSQITATASGWEVIKWPSENLMIISQPSDAKKTCLVANLQTGAWSRFTGLDTSCLAYFDGSGFFGSPDGTISRMETGGSDNGSNYTCKFLGQYEGMGVGPVQKTILQAKATLQAASKIYPLVTVQVDYSENTSGPPRSGPDSASSVLWDGALWDVDVWDGGEVRSTTSHWSSIGRTGFVVAPEVQLTFGTTAKPNVELVSIDVTFTVGALVA